MEKTNLKETRRNFLRTMIPVGGILCMACPTLLDACSLTNSQEKFSKNILNKCSFTYEQYFGDKYAYYIGFMKKFSQYLDKETVISMIKTQLMKTINQLSLTWKQNP